MVVFISAIIAARVY